MTDINFNTVPSEPTANQCNQKSILYESKDLISWATFGYPQMGGYCAKAIVTAPRRRNSCFNVYIWHDSEFPFSDRPPIEIHHCSADQFISFGEEVLSMQKECE